MALLNPKLRESQLILGELEYFLAPLVLKLTPCLEQLAQLGIIRRDLTGKLPPGLEVVSVSGRVLCNPRHRLCSSAEGGGSRRGLGARAGA
jgi:hypothetical protein